MKVNEDVKYGGDKLGKIRFGGDLLKIDPDFVFAWLFLLPYSRLFRCDAK